MTISPKKQSNKYVCNFTSSTSNKGVHTKQTERANIDMSVTNSLEHSEETSNGSLGANVVGAGGAEAETTSQIVSPATDDTASYIQVLVQKHHKSKKRDSLSAAAQTSPRLPTASSPIKTEIVPNEKSRGPGGDGAGAPALDPVAPGLYMLPHPMLFSYPAMAPPLDMQTHYSWPNATRRQYAEVGTSARSSGSFKRLVRAARWERRAGVPPRRAPVPPPPTAAAAAVGSANSFWKKISKISNEQGSEDDAPERVEVFYFARGDGEHLAACEPAARGGAARWAARGERLAERACAELCAPAQCLVMLPVQLLLHVQRLAWLGVRGAAVGSLQVAGDHLLKPALATAFNALLQPPLVCVAHVTRALRDAMRPLWGALGDAVEPCARVVGAARLVHVHVERRPARDV